MKRRLKVKRIAIIGGGNMGEAILRGILRCGLATISQITLSDIRAGRRNRLRRRFRVKVDADNRAAAGQSQIVILAVKPQDVRAVLEEIKPVFKSGTLLISICAGVTTDYIAHTLGRPLPVVRVMPNLPVLIGQGVSAIAKGRHAKSRHVKIAGTIFDCLGDTLTVRENMLDAVTAISGSGPAYVFYILQSLIAAGRSLGLSAGAAGQLVFKTVLGSARLAQDSTDGLTTLVKKVASKGGTTEAALKVFKRKKLALIFAEAVKAAAQRARFLSKI